MARSLIMIAFCFLPLLANAQWDDPQNLCVPVSKKRWGKTGPIIGTFLDSLDYSEENSGKQGRRQRMKALKEWLSTHDCVKEVEILPGTVKQRIPLKELLVTFVLNGHEKPMVIRIALDVPYSFAGIFQKRS